MLKLVKLILLREVEGVRIEEESGVGVWFVVVLGVFVKFLGEVYK